MKNNFYASLDSINSSIWENLVNASVKKNTPFNRPALATINKNKIKLRTMILRKVDKEKKKLIFYTDRRSAKVNDIEENSQVTIYFYDDKKKIQLICTGVSKLEYSSQNIIKIWKSMPSHSKINYMSSLKPGANLDDKINNILVNQDEALFNFSIIYVKIKTIDWLYLSRGRNQRAFFKYVKKNSFNAKWLVP